MCCVLWGILVWGDVLAQPLKFSMGVEPKEGTVEDTFLLTVLIETPGVEGAGNYQKPDLRDFELLDSKNQTSTSTYIAENGATSLSTIQTKRYYLKPKRKGKLWIGSPKVSFRGQRRQASALTLRVVASDPAGTSKSSNQIASTLELLQGFVPPSDAKSEEDLFVHSFLDKKQATVGEQVTVTRLLYSTAEVISLDAISLSFGDALRAPLFSPQKNLQTFDAKVGAKHYWVALVAQDAVFPTEIGVYQVPAYQAKVATMDTPFKAPVYVRSVFENVVVTELPEGMPDSMDPSYVGRYELRANVDRNFLKKGEALTLTLSLSGTGAIERLLPPDLRFDGFEFRKPRDYEETVEVVNGQLRGEKQFKYWTVAKKTGDLTIPAIEIDYYDPRLKVYEKARSLPIPIKVKSDPKDAIQGDDEDSGEGSLMDSDIRLLNQTLELRNRARKETISKRTLIALLLAPWTVLVLAIGGMKLKNRQESNTPRARLKRARKLADRKLKESHLDKKQSRHGKSINQMSTALLLYLEERTGRRLMSSTRHGLRKTLGECELSDVDIEKISSTLNKNDAASYASETPSSQEFDGCLKGTQDLLKHLESVHIAYTEVAK